MKKTAFLILKILVIVIVVGWMALFVTDYFRAQGGSKPFICFEETNKVLEDKTFYRCISLGYKYYEYIDNAKKEATYGFGAVFIKSEIEKEIGE